MQKQTLGLFFIASFLILGLGCRVASAEELSLEEATQILLAQNPELKAMQKETEATRAKIPQAKGWDDPMVGVRFYQVPWGDNPGKAMDIDYIVAQKVPFPGKKKAAGKVAYHEYLKDLEGLNERGRQLVRELKSTYYKLFVIDRQLERNVQIQKALKTSIQAAQANLVTNKTMASEVIQGQTEFAQQNIEREKLLEQRKILETQLKKLLASSPTETIQLPKQLQLPVWDYPLEKLAKLAQENHPTLKSAQHQIGQKEWGIKAAKREYWPDFSTQLEYVQRPGSAQDAWTGELMLNVPLQVNKKKAAVTQAKAELASTQYQKDSAKNNLIAGVEQAYAQAKASERILKLYEKNLIPQARQAFEINSVSYSTGQSSFISLLLAEQNLAKAQKDYWQAYEALALSVAELEENIGLAWEKLAELNPSDAHAEAKGSES